jgi:hypothetical protein
MRRFIGLIDLGVLALVTIAILLPARPMYAMDANKGTADQRFALALAEARSLQSPKDPVASAALSHRLSDAGYKDWAVEEAVRGSARAEGQPLRWKALFAAAEAYVDQYDAEKGVDFAGRALRMCDPNAGDSCPDWERVRIEMYEAQLDAGLRSGIDPRKEPVKFRAAGERALRGARIRGNEAELEPGAPTAPAPPPSGSAGSSAP